MKIIASAIFMASFKIRLRVRFEPETALGYEMHKQQVSAVRVTR